MRAVFAIVCLFFKMISGAITKAPEYQLLARRYFREIKESVEKQTVTVIQARLAINSRSKGCCMVFAAMRSGEYNQRAKKMNDIKTIISSSGKSVPNPEVNRYSNENGRDKSRS